MDDAPLPAGCEEQRARRSPILEDQQRETQSADTTWTTNESHPSLEQNQRIRTASSPEVDLRTNQARLLDQQPELNDEPTPGLEGQQRAAPTADMTGTTRESDSSLEQDQSQQPTLTQNPSANEKAHVKHEHDTEIAARPRRTSQQCYSKHPALELKEVVGDLSTEDAKIADALFVLIPAKQGRVGDHVEGLVRLFVPTRKRLDGVMAMLEKTKVTFDEAESDALKYEAFIEHLEQEKSEDARHFLHLGRGEFKDRLDFAGFLDEIFLPWKQRKMNEHATTCALLSVFERIDKAVDQEWH